MRSLENSLGNWISLKYGDQDGLAAKLGITRAAVSAYKTGRNDIPARVKEAIRKLGYQGPWPREEAQDAQAGGPAPYVTAEEFWKLVGRLEALERAFERQGEIVRDLVRESEESRPLGPKE